MSRPSANASDLRQLLAARFPEKTHPSAGALATGIGPLDRTLGGGLPIGRLTELVSAAPSSGGQLVLNQLLSATRAARQRVALVDGADGFDPQAASPDALRHLVWARCGDVAQALAAADILVRDGNYALVVLDLRGLPERALRRLSATAWYRLQRAAEDGAAAVLVQTTFPLVPAAAWRLRLERPIPLANARARWAVLLEDLSLEKIRGRQEEREGPLPAHLEKAG